MKFPGHDNFVYSLKRVGQNFVGVIGRHNETCVMEFSWPLYPIYMNPQREQSFMTFTWNSFYLEYLSDFHPTIILQNIYRSEWFDMWNYAIDCYYASLNE